MRGQCFPKWANQETSSVYAVVHATQSVLLSVTLPGEYRVYPELGNRVSIPRLDQTRPVEFLKVIRFRPFLANGFQTFDFIVQYTLDGAGLLASIHSSNTPRLYVVMPSPLRNTSLQVALFLPYLFFPLLGCELLQLRFWAWY